MPSTIILLVTLLCAACSRSQTGPGNWTHCACSYLTDFDDRATHNVEVCSPSLQKSSQLAMECAERMAHGHVDSCSCDAPGAKCMTNEPCKSDEYK